MRFAVLLSLLLVSCGGGGSSVALTDVAAPAAPAVTLVVSPLALPAPVLAAPAQAAPAVLAFEELWEPRTVHNAVLGTVLVTPLVETPDVSDPQSGWGYDTIYGKWGTLAGWDGTVQGLPNITGLGGNGWWEVADGRLHFRAHQITAVSGGETGGFALISQQRFDRSRAITLEATLTMAQGTEGAFVGLALIAGEGDYREIAMRIERGVINIKRTAPRTETLLVTTGQASNTLRIEYSPVTGFRYLVNGVLAGTEALDHHRASYAADPQVGLYFVGEGANGAVSGSVGPVRVWTP